MGWDRQPPEVVQAPSPPLVGHWLVAAALAVLVGVLLFLLSALQWVPQIQALNIWLLSGSPVLVWVLAFAARAYVYGGALSQHQFLEEEAQVAQQSWQDWAQRSMAVRASCVLLPDQVSASVLARKPVSLSPRTGLARRIATLPIQATARAEAGLQLLLPALASALQALPAEQELRVTLLCDAQPDHYETLRNVWRQSWVRATQRPLPATVTLTDELPYLWIDEKLKSASTAFDLIVVLQVNGGAAYSDGLAALLLCPDGMAHISPLPVAGALLRPMPLIIDKLESELPLFLQTQTRACQAVGLLVSAADLKPLTGRALAVGAAHGAPLAAQRLWIQESLCGVPGPFSSWLMAAFAVEMARHQQGSLLTLSKEPSRCWISTVTPGEKA